MPNNIQPTNEPLNDKSPAATTALKTPVYDRHADFADPAAADASAGDVADSIPASADLNYAGDSAWSMVNGDKPALSWSSIWKFITPAPTPDNPGNDSGPEANPNGVLDKHEPLADKTPAATAALKELVYDRHADFADPVAVDATAQAVKQFTWAMFLCFVDRVDATAQTVTQPTTWAPNPDSPWNDSNPNGVIDKDEPLDDETPAAKTAFKVLIHDVHLNFIDRVFLDKELVYEPLDDETPAAKTALTVLIDDGNRDVPDPVVVDVTDQTVTQSTLSAANPNGGIDQDEPLDDKTPAATTAFKVLIYDSNWDLVDQMAVDATAQTVVLNVDPATNNNVYWLQCFGTWVNLSSMPYRDEVVTESERLWLDFRLAHDGQFDAADATTPPDAAGHVPLSLVGQAPDLAHGGLWL